MKGECYFNNRFNIKKIYKPNDIKFNIFIFISLFDKFYSRLK